MSNQTSIPKIFVIATVLIGAFMLWPNQPNAKINPAPSQAFAGVGVASENAETLFTASADGKTIYMWQYFSSKPPKFMGQAEAILQEDAK